MVLCPSSVINYFFSSQTAEPILTKLGRNVPWEVLFKNCSQNLIPKKTVVARQQNGIFLSNYLRLSPLEPLVGFLAPWQKASKLLLWCCVCRASVRLSIRPSVNSSFKKLLLDFYQNSQECFLGGSLSNSFKLLCSMKNSGCYGNQSKKLVKIFSQTTNWIALLFCRNVP